MNQLARHFPRLIAHLLRRALPFAAADFVHLGRSAFAAEVTLQAVYLIGRHEQAVAALILHNKVIAQATLHFALDQPPVRPDAVMDMHDEIVFAQIQNALEIATPPATRRRDTTGRAAPNSSASVSTYRRRSVI